MLSKYDLTPWISNNSGIGVDQVEDSVQYLKGLSKAEKKSNKKGSSIHEEGLKSRKSFLADNDNNKQKSSKYFSSE